MKFKVGQLVLRNGSLIPLVVLERHRIRGRRKYLLGREVSEGTYNVDLLVDEDKLKEAEVAKAS